MEDDDVKLLAAIDSYAETAHGSDYNSEISHQRALSIDAFSGKNIEPAREGQSQVVDRSVFETTQEILPSLTRIFSGNDDVVEFEPVGPEDEEVAKQESDYLNYIVTQKNNWELTCHTWFQDALLTKNAYCMVSMDERLIPESERYEGQSPEQVALLLQDDLEIIGQEEVIDEESPVPVTDEMGQPVLDPLTGQPLLQPRVTYNVEVMRTKVQRKLDFKVLPPERVKVAQDTPDFTLEECDYFEYWDSVSISDLRKMGYEIDDEVGSAEIYESLEDTARDDYLEQDTLYNQDIDLPDPALRQVTARWVWVRYDYDGDGIAELQHVVIVGEDILEREVVSTIPVACIVPFINTHRHIGFSVADLVFDIQRIKTALLRGGLDSLYLSQNPRHATSDQVNLDDLLSGGNVVRLKPGAVPGQGHIIPLPTEFVFPETQEGMAAMDAVIEKRVGTNRAFGGLQPDALTSGNAYNVVGQVSSMAAQRVEQIARLFAIGVERLFKIAHELVLKTGHQEEVVRIKGQWVNVDPSQWRTGRDMRIVAPFAAGNKDNLAQRLMMHLQIHEKALASGAPFVQIDDSYALLKMLADATDVPADRIYTDPTTIPPREPGPDHAMIALEIENKKAENEAADEARKAELDKYRADLDAQVKQYQTDVNANVTLAMKKYEQTGRMDVERLKAGLKVNPIDFEGEQIAVSDAFGAMQQANAQMSETLNQAIAQLAEVVAQTNRPKKVVRDDSGRVVGVE